MLDSSSLGLSTSEFSKMRVRTRYQSANSTLIDIEVQKHSDKSAFYPREMKKRCIIFCQSACIRKGIYDFAWIADDTPSYQALPPLRS